MPIYVHKKYSNINYYWRSHSQENSQIIGKQFSLILKCVPLTVTCHQEQKYSGYMYMFIDDGV